LWGKVRKRGEYGLSTAHGPLSLALSHEGRGNLEPKAAGKRLKLGLALPTRLSSLLADR